MPKPAFSQPLRQASLATAIRRSMATLNAGILASSTGLFSAQAMVQNPIELSDLDGQNGFVINFSRSVSGSGGSSETFSLTAVVSDTNEWNEATLVDATLVHLIRQADIIFIDGFESGNTSQWSNAVGR